MLLFNIVAVSLLISSSFSLYDEDYRPQLHFSPPKGWINDPNGLVFHDGYYHLFYQHNPNDTVAANIHWGHAISPDLVHWKHLPIALYPTEGNVMWSGTAISDRYNVSGLQKEKYTETLITVFTAHDMSTSEEKQWLGYSNDGPKYKNFKLYGNNPIIPNPNPSVQKDFRDPAVFKYKDHYVIALAAHDRIMIYNSPDLLKWKLVSEFSVDTHGRIWECPSLFPINVTIDGVEAEKWVLTISLTGEALPSQQYFIGSFDGRTFKNDCSEDTELWVDYGPDSYAGIVFNQVPDGRRIFISWMNKWEYSGNLNFNIWNGQMGVARELKLTHVKDKIRLSSLPVRELKNLRTEKVSKQNIPITNNYVYEVAENGDNKTEHLFDIEMTLDLTNLKPDDSFDMLFCGMNDYLNISFKGNEFTLDRSNAGRTDFPNFAKPWIAKRLIYSSDLKIRIIIDQSSFECFFDNGLTVMTALFYSKENIASRMHIRPSTRDSSIILKDLTIYRLRSIWN